MALLARPRPWRSLCPSTDKSNLCLPRPTSHVPSRTVIHMYYQSYNLKKSTDNDNDNHNHNGGHLDYAYMDKDQSDHKQTKCIGLLGHRKRQPTWM